MQSSQPRIAVESVRKAYRRGSTVTSVLNSVSLTVAAGECVFLAGPSGSGKTTLLSIVGCVLSADAGRVVMLGQDVTALRGRAAAVWRRDQIGFVFQRFHLIRGLTAAENVAIPMILKGTPRQQAHERAEKLLADVGLADYANGDPRQFSVGQCQRVALARSLANDPPIILADEPTAALDNQSGREAMDLLRRLTTEAGKSALVVTHDPRIFSFADRVLHLDNGEIQATSAGRPEPAGECSERPASTGVASHEFHPCVTEVS